MSRKRGKEEGQNRSRKNNNTTATNNNNDDDDDDDDVDDASSELGAIKERDLPASQPTICSSFIHESVFLSFVFFVILLSVV